MAKVKFYDRHDHCIAVVTFALPSIGGQATVAGIGKDKADALARATSVAHRIVGDPVIGALTPEQTHAAITAARGLAAAAQRGLPTLRHFWGRIQGQGKKRLARTLMEEAAKRESAEDVGFLPIALIAAKYGPSAIKMVRKYGPGVLKKLKKRRLPRNTASSPAPEEQAEQSDSPADDDGAEGGES